VSVVILRRTNRGKREKISFSKSRDRCHPRDLLFQLERERSKDIRSYKVGERGESAALVLQVCD
jgi:hypothetical protein